MNVDAHQHFWQVGRGEYGWLTAQDHPLICRDFGPHDLAPLLAEAAIDRTILVQAAPSLAETRFLLDIAERTSFVAGVVGWADFAAPDAPNVIAELSRAPKLLGLRPMLQDLDDDARILGVDVEPALDAMTIAGLTFDALVKPRHLPHLRTLLDRRTELRVVIDHGAKPDIAGGDLDPWAAHMRAIGRDSAACCKLSGLVTEAARGWTAEDLRPFVEVLFEAFGPSRLMWGSDWPVVNEAGGYLAWHSVAQALSAQWSADESAQLFGGTAAAFYGLRP